MAEDSEDFAPSKLGTLDHWEETYQREIQNFKETGDIGEVWFGEDSVEDVLDLISNLSNVTQSSPILDIGCGNGYTLIEMAKQGYTKLSGCDFSARAINLAKEISTSQELDITYFQEDILKPSPSSTKKYQIAVDKGTFDAIALSENSADNRTKYLDYLKLVLDPTLAPCYFVITSCNFTKQELLSHFEKDFAFVSQVKYPTFEFGGRTGSRITTLAFSLKHTST